MKFKPNRPSWWKVILGAWALLAALRVAAPGWFDLFSLLG